MTAQVEHAPTVAQCRADADIWGVPKATASTPNDYQFRNLIRDVAHNQAVTAKKLDVRINELSRCMLTDTAQSFRYEQGSRAYTIAEFMRMADFVSRHNLENQFYQEDDQGKR
jgi:hypothetical protein